MHKVNTSVHYITHVHCKTITGTLRMTKLTTHNVATVYHRLHPEKIHYEYGEAHTEE